jgi:lipoprotein-anchoring transpeptidase ErfK/SrfK
VKRAWGALLFATCALSCDRRTPASSPSPVGPRYYIIGKNGTQTLGKDPRKLLPGFGVVVTEQRMLGGEPIGRTSLGRDIAMKDLRPATPSHFRGSHLDERGLDFGWVVKEGAPVHAQPDIMSKSVAHRTRYTRLTLASRKGPQGFYRVADGWMAETDLRVPRISSRPSAVGDAEPWIDVELTTQTLVAYRGDKPVFATLVATGVGSEGSPLSTPKGIHRIRAKLRAATMDNLDHTGVAPYSYEEVPFTQSIGRVALHGAFWHDQFGVPRSHGCINLTLADAEWLFEFTQPTVVEGELEVAATEKRPGTVVRVR